MIFDNIKNCEMYYGMHPKFKEAFAFIRKAIEENMENCRIELDGTNMRGAVQTYDTKLIENSRFEGHREFIDIQCVIEGYENMGYMEISKAVVQREYKPEGDCALYDRNELATYCVAGPGDFCIFYPDDIHSPAVAYKNEVSKVKKVVVKVHV